MKNQLLIISLFILFWSCKSQVSTKTDFYLMKKEVSKASLRKYAFHQCLNSSVNDSLKIKIKDSSGGNLFYRTYGVDPISNPAQRPYVDSLVDFAKKWGKKEYPNYDHPGTKMHVTNCLNMYESYDLELLTEKIFNESVKEGNIDDTEEEYYRYYVQNELFTYKYYHLYKNKKRLRKITGN